MHPIVSHELKCMRDAFTVSSFLLFLGPDNPTGSGFVRFAELDRSGWGPNRQE